MAEITDFFIDENSIQYIYEEDYETVKHLVTDIDIFARTTYKSVYIIDYYKQNFLYVSDNPIFLCGMTANEVKELGYNFYIKQVSPEDLLLLLEVNIAGFQFLQKVEREEISDYTVSYDFHLINKDSNKKRLINHQITPLRLTKNGKVWLALCTVAISSENKSGNITMSKNKSTEYWYYNRENKKWEKKSQPELKDIEKDVLILSAMGFTMSEIASEVDRSFDTIKAYRKNIFEKLGVDNISEAISLAMNYRLI